MNRRLYHLGVSQILGLMPAFVGEDNRNAISALADQAINADNMQDYISCVFALYYVVVVTIVIVSKVCHIQSARVSIECTCQVSSGMESFIVVTNHSAYSNTAV